MSVFDLNIALTVDASGLFCPLPILRAKKALSQLKSGQVLLVITTDRSAIEDFKAFCRQSGNCLIEQLRNKESCTHYLARR